MDLAAPTMTGGGAQLDAVVTHHRDGFRSGVARFNELLAEHLGIAVLGILESKRLLACARPLLSFKVSELSQAEEAALEAVLERPSGRFDMYLHDLCGSDLERRLLERAGRIHCGNDEIYQAVRPRGLEGAVELVWTPGLILDDRVFQPAEITVFSFGMAHKIRVDMFRRLRGLLDASGRSHVIYVSAANHETAHMRDAQLVFEEMHEIFPKTLYFLGNLSDVAVFNRLQQSTFFAAFFEHGVRANNTSVAAAMERGAVVLTNLDSYSPAEYRHLENVVDIEQTDELPLDPLVLKRISVRAMETGRSRGWDELVRKLS
jgi:hypothetical protein